MPLSDPAAAVWTDIRLGAPHGVTHRRLGDMKDPARRAEACRALGLDPGKLLVGKQVHGTAITRVSGPARLEAVPECDGWLLTGRGAAVGVYVADCLPLFVWDDALSAVGVFHAGWRGLAAGMPREAVRAFARAGVPAARLSAGVGPHVGLCCYEVGPELLERFNPESFREDASGLRLDLGAEARRQLAEEGVDPRRITVSTDCTSCGADRFFSFRREKLDNTSTAGRMLALIGLP